MFIMSALRSTRFAFIFMAFVVAMGIVFGHHWYGWLGVGFVGLVGLVISFRSEMFTHDGDPHERASTHVVRMQTLQIKNRLHDNDDAIRRRQGEDQQRRTFYRVINAVFAAITALGGAMFFLKEF
ncbi:MAG: hypothetical protein WD075_11520 [Rhodospirillales bacterium]